MAVRIRLKRQGNRNNPFYRVVVAEESYSRNGSVLENVGVYDPKKNPTLFDIKEDRVKYWLSVGAQPSETVHRLLFNLGLMAAPEKKEYAHPGFSRKDKKEGKHIAKPEEKKPEQAATEAPAETLAEAPTETPVEEPVVVAQAESPTEEPVQQEEA